MLFEFCPEAAGSTLGIDTGRSRLATPRGGNEPLRDVERAGGVEGIRVVDHPIDREA
jgi:hypothetical protein